MIAVEADAEPEVQGTRVPDPEGATCGKTRATHGPERRAERYDPPGGAVAATRHTSDQLDDLLARSQLLRVAALDRGVARRPGQDREELTDVDPDLRSRVLLRLLRARRSASILRSLLT